MSPLLTQSGHPEFKIAACNLASYPIPPVANPCCNPIVGVVLSPGARQCDDVISLKELLVQRPPGRFRRVRSSRDCPWSVSFTARRLDQTLELCPRSAKV